jgi:hypothetical protein
LAEHVSSVAEREQVMALLDYSGTAFNSSLVVLDATASQTASAA